MFNTKEEVKDLKREFGYLKQQMQLLSQQVYCLRGSHDFQLTYLNTPTGSKRVIACKHCYAPAPAGFVECESAKSAQKK